MTTLDIARLREAATRPEAAHIATFDPPTVLALLDRLDTAEAALGKVRALVGELAHEAQRQSKAHNVEVAAGLWRASDLLRAALAGEPEGSR